MAARLRSSLEGVDGIEFTQDTQANGLYVTLPAGVADPVRRQFAFYDWDAARREVRWMCSFDTTEDDIDSFARIVKEELGKHLG
jgi:threonine aldolase